MLYTFYIADCTQFKEPLDYICSKFYASYLHFIFVSTYHFKKMAEISSADHIVELPVWLNKDFVQKILRDDLQNDSLTVHDLQIEPAVPKGQNFSSILFRVSAEFTLNSGRVDKVKMIIKTQLQADDNVAVIMKELNSFSVEIYAYQILLAKVHELLRSIGDDTVLAPRFVIRK